jgi:hypothetical protein
VYVSDKPGHHDFALLRRLVAPDGGLLRPLLPGRPTRDCLFRDAMRDNQTLLKVGAPADWPAPCRPLRIPPHGNYAFAGCVGMRQHAQVLCRDLGWMHLTGDCQSHRRGWAGLLHAWLCKVGAPTAAAARLHA